jgi:hypothetical protein
MCEGSYTIEPAGLSGGIPFASGGQVGGFADALLANRCAGEAGASGFDRPVPQAPLGGGA